MSDQFVISSERTVVIFSFDLVYPDELIEIIFDKFLEIEGPRFLVTTKNLQGLGAAIRRNTRKLIEDTEDALCLIEDNRANDRDLKIVSRRIDGEREMSLSMVDQRCISTIEEMEVTFGRNILLNKRDAVCITSPQYECCESDLHSLKFEQKSQEQEECHASPDTILEKAKMRFFGIKF